MSMEQRLKEADERANSAHAAQYGNQGKTGQPAPASQASGGEQNPDPDQRYKVLKGKYDKEVPLLHGQVRELEERNRQLQEQLNTRSTLQDEGAVGFDLDLSDDKLPEKLKDFKSEYPDVFNGMTELLKATQKKGAPKKPEASTPPATPAPQTPPAAQPKTVWTEAMYQQLTTLCKDWKSINNHPEFVGWLADKDRYARKTRRELLNDAYAAGDIQTVAYIMQDWEQFYLKAQPPDPDDLAPPAGSPPVNIGDGSGPPVGRMTRAEINKFYTDVSLGRYAGRDEERKALEAKIEQALATRAVV